MILKLSESPGSGPQVKNPFSCSTKLSMKCILHINVILIFIDWMNNCLSGFNHETSFILDNFNIYEKCKFDAQLSCAL